MSSTMWAASGAHGEEMNRALDIAGAGSALLQTFISRVVQSLTLREHGIQSGLSRRSGSGNGAYVNRRSPGATKAEWLTDTDEPSADNGVYTQGFFEFKTMVTRGKVTRGLRDRGRSYADVLQMELTEKAADFAEEFETALAIGDSGVNANQINGLITMINAVSGQVVANTNVDTGDAIDISRLDETIDKVKGAGRRSDLVIFASLKGRRLLNASLQASQQFDEKIEVDAGFRVRSYDDAPIITSTEIPDDLDYDALSTSITGYTGGGTTCVIVVNTRYVYIEELNSTTVMPLAKSSSQYDEFDIFWDGTLVLANPLGAAMLVGVA